MDPEQRNDDQEAKEEFPTLLEAKEGEEKDAGGSWRICGGCKSGAW